MTTELIHKEFRTALDTSVYKHQMEVPAETNSNELLGIGAIGSKNYKKVCEQERERDEIIRKNNFHNKILEIETAYPQYRIISLANVLKLAKKYQLCLGELSQYEETIPEQNVKEIAEYKNAIVIQRVYATDMENLLDGNFVGRRYDSTHVNFLIVAPRRFFTKGLTEIENVLFQVKKPKLEFKWETPTFQTDPIVLHALRVEGTKEIFFHIVSAWDVEAEDEQVSKKIPLTNSDN